MEGKSIYYVLKAFLFIIPLCIVQNNSGQLPAGRVKNEYTGKLLEEFFKLVNNKDKDVNINAVGKWTKVGVAAKTVKGNMYISIVVQVDPKA